MTYAIQRTNRGTHPFHSRAVGGRQLIKYMDQDSMYGEKVEVPLPMRFDFELRLLREVEAVASRR